MGVDARRTPGQRWREIVLLLAVASVVAVACSPGTTARGPRAVTGPASPTTAPALPLRRGYLEIGTYATEVFRPAFSIDIPVSSQWGTYGETGGRVQIGGPDGFLSFLSLSPAGSGLTGPALVRALRAREGLLIESVAHGSFAGLPAVRVSALAGGAHTRITFGGQHLAFFPHEHATLWLVTVGSSRVLVTLGAGESARSFTREALIALRSVQFQTGP
jgi:hypothetical protein